MDEVLLEQIIVYGAVLLLCAFTVFFYLRRKSKKSLETVKKVSVAKEE